MIGQKIYVKTRYYANNPSGGLEFSATLHNPFIEVRKSNLPEGTRIELQIEEIRINQFRKFVNSIESFFEFSDEISVVCHLDDRGIKKFVSLNKKKEADYEFSTSKFPSVRVISRAQTGRRSPTFVNGIAISPLNGDGYFNNVFDLPSLFRRPLAVDNRESVFAVRGIDMHLIDKEGLAPINLARTAFTSKDQGISQKLQELAFEEFCLALPDVLSAKSVSNIKAQTFYNVNKSGFVIVRGGLCPLDVDLIKSLALKKIVCLREVNAGTLELSTKYPEIGFTETLSLDPLMAKTGFVNRIRFLFYQRWLFNAQYVFITEEFFDSVLKLANLSMWMANLFATAEITKSASAESFVSICIAKSDDALNKSMIDLFSETKAGALEGYFCENWSSYPPRQSADSEGPTYFATLWAERFASSSNLFFPQSKALT